LANYYAAIQRRTWVPAVREAKRGDLLAVGIGEGDITSTLRKFPSWTVVQALTHQYRFGRTMGEGAGLYTNCNSNWLWTFRNSEPARYEL